MKTIKTFALLMLMLPFFTSCDLEGIFDMGMVYCIEFEPVNDQGENQLKSGDFDAKQLKVKAVYANEVEEVVYDGEYAADSYMESIFLDFTNNEDADMVVNTLIFELPDGAVEVYELDIKPEKDRAGLVDYDLFDGAGKLVCTTCQQGVKEIEF